MKEPLVSVCMPVFNGARYIRAAIDSVLAQGFRDYELVVSDNCSTDQTQDIVRSYSDPRIRLTVHASNIGMIPNWNWALQEAKGRYIKLLPADDLLYSDCLQSQCRVLEGDANESIALVCGRRHIIDATGRVLMSRGFATKELRVPGRVAINRTVRCGGNIIGEGGAVLFRRSILEKTGLFGSEIFYVFDLALWYRMLLHGDLHCLGQVVSAFRLSEASESTRVLRSQLRDNLVFLRRIYGDPAYRLSLPNYVCGMMNATLIAMAKRVLYGLWVK